MAKASYSPLNQWRGRAGGQVYRVRNGEQIVSSYQPAVSNPKTDAQMMQRAKFNLMTKLNALFDARLLNGFSSSKGIARAMFSKKIMPKIYAQQLAGEGDRKYRANIQPEDIVFSPKAENYLKAGETIATHIQAAAAGTVARLTFTNLPGLFDVDSSTAKIRFVDVYGSSVYNYTEVMCDNISGTEIDDVPNVLDFNGLGLHRLYMQVMVPNNNTSNSFISGSVMNDEGGSNVVADSEANYSTAYTVGGSILIGTVDVSA